METREGWICPQCKRGVSPDLKYCDHGNVGVIPLPPADINPLPIMTYGDPYPPITGLIVFDDNVHATDGLGNRITVDPRPSARHS